jgi:hypothetical protein
MAGRNRSDSARGDRCDDAGCAARGLVVVQSSRSRGGVDLFFAEFPFS